MGFTSILLLLLGFFSWAFIVQLIWRKPLYGLLAYALLFPLLPVEAGIRLLINFRWQQLCALLFLLPALVRMALVRCPPDKLDVTVLCYALCSSVSAMFLTGTYTLFGQIFRNVLYVLLPFLAFRYIPKSIKDINSILIALIVSGMLVSFEGIYEFILEKRIFMEFPITLDPRYEFGNPFRFGAKRVFASLYDPVYLGTYIGLIAILAAYIVMHSRRRWSSLIATFQLLLTPVLFLFSQARTAVVSCALILPILFFGESKKRLIKLSFYLTAISAILIPIILTANIYDITKLSQAISDIFYYGVLDSSATFNLDGRWATSIYGLESSWPPNLIGEGSPEIFRKLYNQFGMADIGNGFVSKLAWEGLVAALFFYLLIFYFMWILARRLSFQPVVKYLLLALVYFWVADQLTAQMSLITILWWILGGLGLSIDRIARRIVQQQVSHLSSSQDYLP